MIISTYLPRFLELILDFQRNVPDAKDPSVLNLFSTLVRCLGHHMKPFVPDILSNLFDCTLSMITQDL